MGKTFRTRGPAYPKATPIRTTLYELIEAINEEVPPGKDWVVSEVVLHLLETGQIKLVGQPEDFSPNGG